jgi:hypothetical protein
MPKNVGGMGDVGAEESAGAPVPDSVMAPHSNSKVAIEKEVTLLFITLPRSVMRITYILPLAGGFEMERKEAARASRGGLPCKTIIDNTVPA